MERLVLWVAPVAKLRPRFTRTGRCYTPEKTLIFERRLRQEAKALWRGGLLKGPLELRLFFFVERKKSVVRSYPTTRPDLDNYIKAVKDAMNGVLWVDDAQVVDLFAIKRYGSPRIELEVGPVVEIPTADYVVTE